MLLCCACSAVRKARRCCHEANCCRFTQWSWACNAAVSIYKEPGDKQVESCAYWFCITGQGVCKSYLPVSLLVAGQISNVQINLFRKLQNQLAAFRQPHRLCPLCGRPQALPFGDAKERHILPVRQSRSGRAEWTLQQASQCS